MEGQITSAGNCACCFLPHSWETTLRWAAFHNNLFLCFLANLPSISETWEPLNFLWKALSHFHNVDRRSSCLSLTAAAETDEAGWLWNAPERISGQIVYWCTWQSRSWSASLLPDPDTPAPLLTTHPPPPFASAVHLSAAGSCGWAGLGCQWNIPEEKSPR